MTIALAEEPGAGSPAAERKREYKPRSYQQDLIELATNNNVSQDPAWRQQQCSRGIALALFLASMVVMGSNCRELVYCDVCHQVAVH